MKLTFLGTGTSHGVPVIGCDCEVCRSTNPKDRRYRSSVYIETKDKKYILIDAGPEFRLQAVENRIRKIDAILLTHSHADHLHGIDDIRIFSVSCYKRTDKNAAIMDAPPLPIYANDITIKDVKKRFDYFFTVPKEGGGHAKVELFEAKQSFTVGDVTITPVPMMHGHLPTLGWLLREGENSIAYLTDCSYISPESIELLKTASGQKDGSGHIEHLIIDGLRIQPHSTHFNFDQALEAAEKIGGNKVWLTHLTHHHTIAESEAYIKDHTKMDANLPWDKLTIEC